MKKSKLSKILSFSALAMLFALPVSTLAGTFSSEKVVVSDVGHVHEASSATTLDAHGSNEHSDYVALTSLDQIYDQDSGLYTLNADTTYVLQNELTLSNSNYITVENENVTFCLNGNTLTGGGSTIFYVTGSLTVCDTGSGIITGGSGYLYNNGYSSYRYGGAFYVSGGSVTLEGGTVQGNSASGTSSRGGAFYVSNGSLTLDGGTIYNNSSYDGGGVGLGGNATITINSGSITGNTASHYGGGIAGAIGSYSYIYIDGGAISSNRATSSGGGIYGAYSTIEMTAGEISGNIANASSGGSGGGVYIITGSLTMTGGVISGNYGSTNGGGNGGGVYVSNYSTFTLDGGSVTGNYAGVTSASYGGGVYLTTSSTSADADFIMNSGTVSGNMNYSSGSNSALYIDTSTCTFTMNDGYFGGSVTSSGSTSVAGGYLDSNAYEDLQYSISEYTATVKTSADSVTAYDSDYTSNFPYAVYNLGTTPNYSFSSSISKVCVDTSYSSYLTFSGNESDYEVSYSYSSNDLSGQGLPTAVGTYMITASVSDSLDTTTSPKTYIPSAEASFYFEIVDHVYQQTSDDTNHWDECNSGSDLCDASTINVEQHQYNSTYTGLNSGHYQTCTVCNRDSATVDHVYSSGSYTSTITGHYQECTLCGVETSLVDHTFTSGAYESTEDGHYQVCTVCSGSSVTSEHTFGDWVVTRDATAEEDGEQQRTCSVCSYAETAPLPYEAPVLDGYLGIIIASVIGGIALIVIILLIIIFSRKKKKAALAASGNVPAVAGGYVPAKRGRDVPATKKQTPAKRDSDVPANKK